MHIEKPCDHCLLLQHLCQLYRRCLPHFKAGSSSRCVTRCTTYLKTKQTHLPLFKTSETEITECKTMFFFFIKILTYQKYQRIFFLLSSRDNVWFKTCIPLHTVTFYNWARAERFCLNMGRGALSRWSRGQRKLWALNTFCAPMCAFSASTYGGNVFIYVKKNTKFRHQMTIKNIMEYKALRHSVMLSNI